MVMAIRIMNHNTSNLVWICKYKKEKLVDQRMWRIQLTHKDGCCLQEEEGLMIKPHTYPQKQRENKNAARFGRARRKP